MINIPSDYAGRVREARGRLDLTQAELAKRLGVSYATVNRWENRQTKPNRLAWQRFVELAEEVRQPTTAVPAEPHVGPATLDFAGNSDRARLLVEAERLSFGHAANPTFATETSRIDPLPHQRIAVYDRMLQLNPLRFLLADDAGAGKTIMTGLYIREMLSRRLLRRVLIVPPAGLVGNWRRELEQLFGLRFEIVRGADVRADNPFVGTTSDRLIISVDTLAAASARRRLQEECVEPYDLVVFDEAHKLSARRDLDGTFRATNRYRLAEAVAGVRPIPEEWFLHWRAHHLLLLTATPHMGKDYPYFCLWRLLEPDGFSTPEGFADVPPHIKQQHFIRRTKEEMVKLDGSPLYTRRVSDTLAYELTQGEDSEQTLYDLTTRYIRNNYNTARILNRSAARFAMMIFQRRLVSSTWALIRSFERRLEKLEGLIRDIRSGRISEEELVLGQVRLDREIEDPLETLTADEEEAVDGLEQNEAAEAKTLAGVVATSLAELEVERAEVAGLLDLARQVDARGDDSKFERLRGVFTDPAARGDKLIVFTEHRDTLDFLVRRLEGLGFAGRIAQIHGGMDFEKREYQVEHFKRKPEEGGADFLVATDAAGEGINLQFCWRMVNYDIPWNPARLEQRMGRIHRYGQEHDPVVIINLVAAKTREGRVLKILLEKLEKIREELGSDKVFDVIGRIFEGVSLRDYMEQALTAEGAEEAAAAIESQLTPSRVDELHARSRKLYGADGDIRPELPRLRDEIDRETYSRLLPGYVQRFLELAGRELGFRLEADTDGLFSLRATRAGSLDFLLPTIESRARDTHPRLALQPRADNDAILVHPGEPVFDCLCQEVRQRFARDAARGSVLVDPSAAEPYLLHVGLLEVRRRGAENNPELAQEVPLETRLVALRQGGDGSIELSEPERLLLTQTRQGVPPTALPLVARAAQQREDVAAWLDEHVVAGAAERWRDRLASAAGARANFLRRGFDHRAAELAVRRSELGPVARAGNLRAQKALHWIRAEQRQLAERRAAVMDAADLEPTLVEARPLRFIAHFLVVPADGDEARQRFDAEVEATAVRVAIAHEEALGAVVQDVSTPAQARAAGLIDWPGFDLLSKRPSGEELAIEVKGRATSGSIELTENEWARACNLREGYWLYVVYGCGSAHSQLLRVQDPFGALVASPTGGMVIDQRQIAAAAAGGQT